MRLRPIQRSPMLAKPMIVTTMKSQLFAERDLVADSCEEARFYQPARNGVCRLSLASFSVSVTSGKTSCYWLIDYARYLHIGC